MPHRKPSPEGSGDLTIDIGRTRGTVVVRLTGSLDDVAAGPLKATLDDLIDGQGNLAVALDLRDLHRIALAGLDLLSAAASDLRRRGGRLSLCEARGGVLDALHGAELARFVRTPLREEAERKPDPDAGVSDLQNRRSRFAHPAGRGWRENVPNEARTDERPGYVTLDQVVHHSQQRPSGAPVQTPQHGDLPAVIRCRREHLRSGTVPQQPPVRTSPPPVGR